MKNKASDVHNILMEQLERLNDLDDEDMKNSEKLTNEIKRAEAINNVAKQINDNGRIVLDVLRLKVAIENPEKVEVPDALMYLNDPKMLPAPEEKKTKIRKGY